MSDHQGGDTSCRPREPCDHDDAQRQATTAVPAAGGGGPRPVGQRPVAVVKIPILTWHAVLPLPEGTQVRGAVSLRAFETQVAWLARRGFTSLSMDAAADLLAGRGTPPRRPVVLSFDDGYRCVLQHALPVLEAAGLRATLFVVTGSVGATTGWYLAKGGQSFEHAGWDELERAAAAGHGIGSHTVQHRRLTNLSPVERDAELTDSREALRARFGACDHLAYPFGSVSEAVAESALRCGYRTACTTQPGRNAPGQPLAWLRRQTIGRSLGVLGFAHRAGLPW